MKNSTPIKGWDIAPYEGTGPLRFGMTRSQVRSLLRGSVSTFRKGPYASTDTDAYDELGLHLHYDKGDRLECIEAWGPCPIYYQRASLLNANTQEVLERLAGLGLSSRYDDGYFLDDAGFALYAPDDVVEAVTVYPRGYYDERPDETSNG
jgi:hypothetical protein